MSSDLDPSYLLLSHPKLASAAFLQFQFLAFSLLLILIIAFPAALTGPSFPNTARPRLQCTPAHGFLRRPFAISSHPDTARNILNSSAFADRPVKESAYELLFHRAMGFAPFGDYWRNLRRISATHLFSPRRIAAFGAFRGEIGAKMVEEIQAGMGEKGEAEVRRVLHFGSLNNVMMTVFVRSYECGREKDGLELDELVKKGYELLGKFNWSNHFPLLGWLDLLGVRRTCRSLVGKA